jgi:hypothetical protein
VLPERLRIDADDTRDGPFRNAIGSQGLDLAPAAFVGTMCAATHVNFPAMFDRHPLPRGGIVATVAIPDDKFLTFDTRLRPPRGLYDCSVPLQGGGFRTHETAATRWIGRTLAANASAAALCPDRFRGYPPVFGDHPWMLSPPRGASIRRSCEEAKPSTARSPTRLISAIWRMTRHCLLGNLGFAKGHSQGSDHNEGSPFPYCCLCPGSQRARKGARMREFRECGRS